MHFCCRAPYGARGLKSSLGKVVVMMVESRPVWGAWIEIRETRLSREKADGRAPYGARGLKFASSPGSGISAPSRPVWGAWIEIYSGTHPLPAAACRAPYGARGLKYYAARVGEIGHRRAPYGARGLKCGKLARIAPGHHVSRPVWGAWIEIRETSLSREKAGVAPRMGRVD